jgi:hypothetical protein
MEFLTQPKATYLLEASLDVLHAQSVEWLSEIAFWRDETAFIYTLVLKKTLKSLPVNAESAIEQIESELILLSSGDLDDLEKAVEQHEIFLGDLLESKYLSERNYRGKHEQLMLKFCEFERRFKDLKREVFQLVERSSKTS